MSTNRRSILKLLAGAGAATAATGGAALAAPRLEAPAGALGMLYDTTLCIGCKACVVACHEANGLPAERNPEGLHDAPQDLSSGTKNVIKLYREGSVVSYMKSQCMHCVDPACVSACMIGALTKDATTGVVSWEGSRCVGCRYCQLACPFNIPKFEWTSVNPKIVKCELCRHLLAGGGIPACVKACPRKAVIFGRREDLLAEAKRRIAEKPDLYVPRVYGEGDGGGTQVLYVSHVPFGKLGLPELGDASPAARARGVHHAIYKGFAAPLALYAVLGALIFRNRRRQEAGGAAGPGEDPGAGEGGTR
jgi:Fe-S-cluster-containing dehydrogenase component